MIDLEKRLQIRQLNDAYRQTFDRCNITKGVAQLGPFIGEIANRVRKFDNFDPDDALFDEHDFGAITFLGRMLFWKIDYYDKSMLKWCNPLNINCRRVLTIMLAEEY